ncbi:MAG: energy-coupling factor transporter ATPase [Clostridia bacterium]|nr:energy-coupling factor transporter ATPase [Clostridia bacterium]MBQ5800946.1 energy-coupling factor transporter ATPase [Clostridia bacterium]
MNILELENVSYIYGADTPYEINALKDISISFEKGKITGLIGHTGSGKSTLVQMLNGLIKPHSGRILLNGKDIWENPKKIRDIRFRVGLVMQYPEYQLFDDTVRSDIGFALRNMELSEDEIRERTDEAMKFVGLDSSLYEKSPFEISGGQKRRVAIAGVVAMRPEVLVLDEPAAGLDPRGRKEILGRLRDYQRERNATVILVSHSMEDMANYCDNIVVLNQSKVFLSGTTEEVFSRAGELSAVGLDIPQIAHVAEILKNKGFHLEGELYTVDGVKEAILKLLSKKGGFHNA